MVGSVPFIALKLIYVLLPPENPPLLLNRLAEAVLFDGAGSVTTTRFAGVVVAVRWMSCWLCLSSQLGEQ